MLTIKRMSIAHVLAAGTASVALLTAGLVAAVSESDASAENVAQPTAKVSRASAQAFRVLRDERATAVPPAARVVVAEPGDFGRNVNLAREIDTANGPGWVVPGDQSVCLLVPDPVDGYATTCRNDDDARADGVYLGLVDGKTRETQVTLLMPDGSRAIDVTTPAGEKRTLRIDSDGVARGTVPGGSVVSTTTPSGVETQAVGAPPR